MCIASVNLLSQLFRLAHFCVGAGCGRLVTSTTIMMTSAETLRVRDTHHPEQTTHAATAAASSLADVMNPNRFQYKTAVATVFVIKFYDFSVGPTRTHAQRLCWAISRTDSRRLFFVVAADFGVPCEQFCVDTKWKRAADERYEAHCVPLKRLRSAPTKCAADDGSSVTTTIKGDCVVDVIMACCGWCIASFACSSLPLLSVRRPGISFKCITSHKWDVEQTNVFRTTFSPVLVWSHEMEYEYSELVRSRQHPRTLRQRERWAASRIVFHFVQFFSLVFARLHFSVLSFCIARIQSRTSWRVCASVCVSHIANGRVNETVTDA